MSAGAVRLWIFASLLVLSSGCTTPPASDTAPSTPAPGASSRPAAMPPAEAGVPAESSPVAAPLLPANEALTEFEQGKASWYGPRFNGRRTASGERYNMHELTAAHKTLPFGTLVRVRSLVNGKEVDVRITDRGPFSRDRVIDLSRAAAEALGMLGLGVKDVLLLVPASTPPVAEPPPAGKPARVKRRARSPR
ncbi:MAG: septal ring lytic transglycosylase RlpA family protein [Polaromonas sp.]